MYQIPIDLINTLLYPEVVFFTSEMGDIYVEENRYVWEQVGSMNKTKEIREDLA